MQRRIATFLLLLILPITTYSDEAVMRSSVSPNLVDGLQAKYLRYIAEKANMELHLDPMPFARRLALHREGKLDVLVGIQQTYDFQDEVIYLQPSYEKLQHAFFILAENKPKLTSFDDLEELSIGVTIHAKYFERFNKNHDLAMVPVHTLEQKIQLLMNGRIDTFLHFRESTLPKLQEMGLSEQIQMATYQPIETNKYYFSISENSPLIKHRKDFESIIAEGIKNGDFARIRQEHYTNNK